MELKGKKVNFLGDSITEGVGASCESTRYTDVFVKETEVGVMRNYGISATRIANQQKVERDIDELSFCQRFDQMDDDADIVVVFGGTNDYGHGDAPFGTFEDRTPETFCGACHYLMRGLIGKYTDKTVVFMTPLHREFEFEGRPLKEYVDVIKQTAEYYSIPVVDLFATVGICPALEEQKVAFCPDGLHPNDAGSRKVAMRLKAFLEAL